MIVDFTKGNTCISSMEMALQDEFYANSVSFSKFNDSVLKSTVWFNQKSST